MLLCPQLDHKKRTIDSCAYWAGGRLSSDKARVLREQGFIQHSPTFRHGRAIYNEVFWLRPHTILDEIQAPTLIVHGTADTLVPIDTSLAAMDVLNNRSRLEQIDGDQHGFAVDGDPTYAHPQSQVWQAHVIHQVADWITAEN